MNGPPRWFWPLLAACAVALTAAGTYFLTARANVGRYTTGARMMGEERDMAPVLDTRTGITCAVHMGTGAPATDPWKAVCVDPMAGKLTARPFATDPQK